MESSNGLFLFYEDLIKVLSEFVMLMTYDGQLFPNSFNLPEAISKVSHFLNKPMSEMEIEILAIIII